MLSAYKFGAFPVVANGQLVGIITREDMLRLLSELMGPPQAAS